MSLHQKGYFNFGRVGCLKKINRVILPYSLYHKKSDDDKEDLNELNKMLEDISCAQSKAHSKKEKERLEQEKESIEEAIKQLQNVNGISRKDTIMSRRVIGNRLTRCYNSIMQFSISLEF